MASLKRSLPKAGRRRGKAQGRGDGERYLQVVNHPQVHSPHHPIRFLYRLYHLSYVPVVGCIVDAVVVDDD